MEKAVENNTEISLIIGENLKRLRLERNLSLGQLSGQSGVSKVMLSQIEKGTSNPSINTIWKIADALQVPYTALLDRNVDHGAVISLSELDVQKLDNGEGTLCCYYHNTQNRNFELFLMTMNPGASHTSEGHDERTDEYLVVIKGSLIITLDDDVRGHGSDVHNLRAGDSISFHSNKTHTYHNPGKAQSKLMIINYYR